MFDINDFDVINYKKIYLNDRGELIPCIIDKEDYDFASQWRWQAHWSKQKKKAYARRATRINGKPISVYLHKEICYRAHGLPPSDRHIIGDHMDGNSLNNCRDNLRWATPSQNASNLHGFYAQQLRMAFIMKEPDRILFGKDRFK